MYMYYHFITLLLLTLAVFLNKNCNGELSNATESETSLRFGYGHGRGKLKVGSHVRIHFRAPVFGEAGHKHSRHWQLGGFRPPALPCYSGCPALFPTQSVTGQMPEVGLLMIKLRISTQLRNNIVNVFGYILFQPKLIVDVPLYITLYDLYNGARLKRIDTCQLLPLLKQMAYMNPQQQFAILFLGLSRIVPKYLSGACITWTDYLVKNKVNMNAILRPNNGPLQADFLADMDTRLLDILLTPIVFKPSSKQLASQLTIDSLGVFFKNIIGALMDGSLVLKQSLIAAFMLNMQLESFRPEVDEGTRYLADVFNEDRLELDFLLKAVLPAQIKNPYLMIRKVLTTLIQAPENNNIDPNMKDAASTVVEHFSPPSILTYNPQLNKYSPVVTGRNINFDLLFNVISAGEFPRDIIDAKELILKAIRRREINMALVLKGFVRFDYTNPRDLLIVLLNRLHRRGFLNQKLSDAVLAIISHLKVNLSLCLMEPRPTKTVTDIVKLLFGFLNPAMPKEIRNETESVMNELFKLQINWNEILNQFPDVGNTFPRRRLLKLLLFLVTSGAIKDMKLIGSIEDLARKFDDNGNPTQCPVLVCPRSSIGPITPQVITILKTPQKPQYVTPSGDACTFRVSSLDMDSLLNSIRTEGGEKTMVDNIKKILKSSDIMRKLAHIKLCRYSTQGRLLGAILNELLNSKSITISPQGIKTIKFCMSRIQLEGIGAQRWKTMKRVLNLNEVLMSSIDIDKLNSDRKNDSIDRLNHFLNGATGFNINNIEINDLLSATRAEFLRQFFTRITDKSDLSAEITQDIKKVMNYVVNTGYGALPVPYSKIILDANLH